jgi:hypothetical protein
METGLQELDSVQGFEYATCTLFLSAVIGKLAVKRAIFLATSKRNFSAPCHFSPYLLL